MTIWQPSTDTLWEFWQASKQYGGWHASWGGAIKHVSQSPGYYTPNSWPGLSASNWGGTATSLPVIGGTMLVRDLRSPWIRHALALDLPAPEPDTTRGPPSEPTAAAPRTRSRRAPACACHLT